MSFDLKKCRNCTQLLHIENFSVCLIRQDKTYFRPECKKCRQMKVSDANKKHYQNNQENIKKNSLKYYIDNKEKVKKRHSIYIVEYQCNNKEKIKIKAREFARKYRKNPIYRLRTNISRSIREALFNVQSSKGNRTIFNYLPYSFQELRNHLESMFEPWMNWNNYGVYSIDSWNDENVNTWTWQIDHIIPQSKFIYHSMEDESFRECWSLSNIRPYSSKLNVKEGNRR